LEDAKEHGELLRAGHSLEDAKNFGNALTGVSPEDAKLYADLLTQGISLENAKLYADLLRQGISLENAKLYADLLRQNYSLDDAKLYADLLRQNYSLDDAKLYADLLRQGISLDDAKLYADLLRLGISLDDAKLYADLLRQGMSLEESIEYHNDTIANPSLLIKNAKSKVLNKYASNYNYTSSFEAAVALATSILTDKTLTSSVPTPINLNNLQSGYNLEFIRLLSAYGALGSNGEKLAEEVLGSTYSSYSAGGTISSMVQNSSKDYLGFLSTLTGSRAFSSEDSVSSVLDVALSNIQLSTGSTLTLGSAEADSTIDVNEYLTKASSKSNRKILVIGAAKDLNSAGNIKFTNSNNIEDHALVLGAADDVNINGNDIEYTGSNLGIGSGDTGSNSMWLVNTKISSGGNLAVGSLGTMNISDAVFSVGTANSMTSDPDNVYLYANEIISINNLRFTGRIDDIYMESKTIHIKNTSFPKTAEVMFRTQFGSLHIQNNASDIVAGGVNLHKVKHLGISNENLVRTQFQGPNGNIKSTASFPNGTPFIKIKSQ
jgi:hypothetical protein